VFDVVIWPQSRRNLDSIADSAHTAHGLRYASAALSRDDVIDLSGELDYAIGDGDDDPGLIELVIPSKLGAYLGSDIGIC
jgi:hypothetical protein